MKTLPLIVIGHVDHGKTTLVKALSGIDTDRLPEEKARGVSIVPGFAFGEFDELIVDFIDAPGHENYVQAMVSGASGARAALLVVSAIDGMEAQTIEHLEIIKHLGVQAGVIAVTKADLVSDAERVDIEVNIRAGLRKTRLQDAQIVFCSSLSGEGVEDIIAAIQALPEKITARAAPYRVFLPIDRVFTSQGVGTIVTGTLLGGEVCVDDELNLSTLERRVSVRAIETRGTRTERAMPRQRVALNLRNVEVSDIKRGDVLHTEGVYQATQHCDVEITLSETLRQPLRHMTKVRVLLGTAHTIAAVQLYTDKIVEPGAKAFARLHFDRPVTLFSRQRIMLRSLSPRATLGGAHVIDPLVMSGRVNKAKRLNTLKSALSGCLADLMIALADEGQGVAKRKDLMRLAGDADDRVDAALPASIKAIADDVLAPLSVIEDSGQAYLQRVKAYHSSYPLRLLAPLDHVRDQGLASELCEYLERQFEIDGVLHFSEEGVCFVDHSPVANLTDAHKHRTDVIALKLRQAGLKTPPIGSFVDGATDTDLVELLVHAGTLIRLYNVSLKQSLIFHKDAIKYAILTLRNAYSGDATFTTGEARSLLGTTRKYIVPLLEYLDSKGVTARVGDERRIAEN